MPLTVNPILPRFGAEVSGVDITRPRDPPLRREVVRTMKKLGGCG